MSIQAKKSLGQNFLQDEQVLQKIASSIQTKPNDLIIEIGAGKGALTKYLKQKGSYLVCYEIDKDLSEYLTPLNDTKTKIIINDFLAADINNDLSDFNYDNLYIIANIPYYITTPIIKKVLSLTNLKGMSLLVQKEVGKRFGAKVNTKEYGSLTVYLNYYFDIDYLFDVKNTCFKPVPKVDSAVVSFKRKERINKVINEESFNKLVNDAFQMKRKTLKNNLKEYDFNKINKILNKHNLAENVRAEQVPVDVFIEISNELEKGKHNG